MNVNSPTIKCNEAPAGTFNPPVPFETTDLRKMGVEELANLREVVRMTIDIVAAFSCQPKFRMEAEQRATPAGRQLEDFMLWLDAAEMKIMNAVYAAEARSVAEVEAKSWCVLQREAHFAEDLSEFAILAAQAARDDAAAEHRARYAR